MSIVNGLVDAVGHNPKTDMILKANEFLSSIGVLDHQDVINEKTSMDEFATLDGVIYAMDDAVRTQMLNMISDYGITLEPELRLDYLTTVLCGLYQLDQWEDTDTIIQMADEAFTADDAFVDVMAEVTGTPDVYIMEWVVNVSESFKTLVINRMKRIEVGAEPIPRETIDRRYIRAMLKSAQPKAMVEALENGLHLGLDYRHYTEFVIHGVAYDAVVRKPEEYAAEYLCAFLATGQDFSLAEKVVPQSIEETYEQLDDQRGLLKAMEHYRHLIKVTLANIEDEVS